MTSSYQVSRSRKSRTTYSNFGSSSNFGFDKKIWRGASFLQFSERSMIDTNQQAPQQLYGRKVAFKPFVPVQGSRSRKRQSRPRGRRAVYVLSAADFSSALASADSQTLTAIAGAQPSTLICKIATMIPEQRTRHVKCKQGLHPK